MPGKQCILIIKLHHLLLLLLYITSVIILIIVSTTHSIAIFPTRIYTHIWGDIFVMLFVVTSASRLMPAYNGSIKMQQVDKIFFLLEFCARERWLREPSCSVRGALSEESSPGWGWEVSTRLRLPGSEGNEEGLLGKSWVGNWPSFWNEME